MKNFKYIAILLTFTLFMGCGEDDVDSITNDGTYSPTSEISVGFTDINDGPDTSSRRWRNNDFVVSHSIGALT